eukprot:4765957-Amphidinium_carterae.3
MRFAQLVGSSLTVRPCTPVTKHAIARCSSHMRPTSWRSLELSKVELTSSESPELTSWRQLKEESKWPKLGGIRLVCASSQCEYLGIEADLFSSKSSTSVLKLKMSASSQAMP